MMYEVEQKHAVASFSSVEAKLAALEVRIGGVDEQSDCYYRHPCRDFASTDEALRIRSVAGQDAITYKGPKLDTAAKTRQEIELPLPPANQQGSFADLLAALGFETVRKVVKLRRKAMVPWAGHQVEAVLDEVAGLGCFVELELQADADNLAAAQTLLASLAEHLELGPSIRASYLEMLIEREEKEH